MAQRTHKNVSEAVIRIRRSKLPIRQRLEMRVPFSRIPQCHEKWPRIWPGRTLTSRGILSADGVKLAAGWLIEKAAGRARSETHGVHDKQALCLCITVAQAERKYGPWPRHHGFRPNHLWGDLGTGGQSNWTSGLRSPEESAQYSTQGW